MATARTKPAEGDGQEETPAAANEGQSRNLEAPVPAEQVAGDPKSALHDDGPGDPVKLATARAAKKARAGSASVPVAPESVVMGHDALGVPVAVASHPAPTNSSEVQEAAADAVLRSSSEELTDEDGNKLSGNVFEDRHPESAFVYTTQRVYKTQMMPHSTRPTSVLVYPANAAVARGEAEAFQARLK